MSKKLINPVEFVTAVKPEVIKEKVKEQPKKKESTTIEIIEEEVNTEDDSIVDFSMSKFLEDGDEIYTEEIQPTQVVPKSRKKKSVSTKNVGGKDVITSDDDDEPGGLKHFQTDRPYQDTYGDSIMGLDTAINQLDELTMSVRGDLEELRSNKTIRGRHKNISEMTSAMSSLISTKIGAIREKNSVISKSHDLELKRIKDLNLNAVDKVDHDRSIMDSYNAFISMPSGGSAPQQYMPPSMNMMTDPAGYNSGIINTNIGNSDAGFENYQRNITAVQNRMRYEDNPDVQTVVLYDRNTGQRSFDVRNIKTGESIPNIQRPDAMFLEDTTIDINNGVARNANIDTTYPVIEVGAAASKY